MELLTREIVDIDNIEVISCPVLSNDVYVEQSKTLFIIRWKNDNEMYVIAEVPNNNNSKHFTSRRRSSLASLSSNGLGGSSVSEIKRQFK